MPQIYFYQSAYHFILLITCRRAQEVCTETAVNILGDRLGGDVLLKSHLHAGGQVQVGAGAPKALAGIHVSLICTTFRL